MYKSFRYVVFLELHQIDFFPADVAVFGNDTANTAGADAENTPDVAPAAPIPSGDETITNSELLSDDYGPFLSRQRLAEFKEVDSFNTLVEKAAADKSEEATDFLPLIEKRYEYVGGNIQALLFDNRKIPIIKDTIDRTVKTLRPEFLSSLDLVDIGGDISSSLYSICVIPPEKNDTCMLRLFVRLFHIYRPPVQQLLH